LNALPDPTTFPSGSRRGWARGPQTPHYILETEFGFGLWKIDLGSHGLMGSAAATCGKLHDRKFTVLLNACRLVTEVTKRFQPHRAVRRVETILIIRIAAILIIRIAARHTEPQVSNSLAGKACPFCCSAFSLGEVMTQVQPRHAPLLAQHDRAQAATV
jgi:hypothetical protein